MDGEEQLKAEGTVVSHSNTRSDRDLTNGANGPSAGSAIEHSFVCRMKGAVRKGPRGTPLPCCQVLQSRLTPGCASVDRASRVVVVPALGVVARLASWAC